MATIGIDFGTSFCSASWINPTSGKPEAVRFKDCGSEKLPSIIAFNAKEQPFVGSGPYMQLEELAANTSLSQEERDAMLSNFYTSIKTNIRKDQQWIRPNKTYSDADLISLILKKIKDEVAISCPINEPIDQVVLTHPVQFEEWKKEVLKHAAALAGFRGVILLEEPIAAAIYAIKSGTVPKSCKGLLVYDFGAGTFDVSYIKVENDGELHMPVMPRGDAHCGGDDIDRALYQDWNRYVSTALNQTIGNGQELDVAFMYRCRRRKEQISRGFLMSDEITEYIPGIGNVKRHFSVDDFESLTIPIIEKTLKQVREVTKDVKQKNLPLTHAILIGGSSNLPLVQAVMKEELGDGVQIVTTGNNDIAVAVGAMYSVSIQVHGPQPPKPGTPKPEPPKPQPIVCYCIHCRGKIMTSDRICMHCGKPNSYYNRESEF